MDLKKQASFGVIIDMLKDRPSEAKTKSEKRGRT